MKGAYACRSHNSHRLIPDYCTSHSAASLEQEELLNLRHEFPAGGWIARAVLKISKTCHASKTPHYFDYGLCSLAVPNIIGATNAEEKTMSSKVKAQTIREYEAIGWGGKPTVTDLGRSTSVTFQGWSGPIGNSIHRVSVRLINSVHKYLCCRHKGWEGHVIIEIVGQWGSLETDRGRLLILEPIGSPFATTHAPWALMFCRLSTSDLTMPFAESAVGQV